MKNIIQSFDNYLFKNKFKFDAVVIVFLWPPRAMNLMSGYPWVCEQDLNPLWPKHVETVYNKIRKRLGYES